jgi:hypothetical protein
LEEDREGVFADAGFVTAAFRFAFGFDLAGPPALTEAFTPRDDLRSVFVDFDFGLLVAIGLSPCVMGQHSALPPTQAHERVHAGLGVSCGRVRSRYRALSKSPRSIHFPRPTHALLRAEVQRKRQPLLGCSRPSCRIYGAFELCRLFRLARPDGRQVIIANSSAGDTGFSPLQEFPANPLVSATVPTKCYCRGAPG